MSTIWFTSDTHFGHENSLAWKLDSGDFVRKGFRDASHMDETIVERWNGVVKPYDKVYHLGDVAMRKANLAIVKRLNGKKRLILGNHDIFEVKDYLAAGFQKVMAMRVLEDMIFTHVPIHTQCLERFKRNVHGHLHGNFVKSQEIAGHNDERYLNICVEQTNYTPVSLEEIKAKIK